MKYWILPALALASAAAHAEDARGLLFGVGGGRSSLKIDSVNFDGSDTAWKVFAGYRFNKWLDAEVAYIDAGNAGDNVAPGVALEISADTWQASLVGTYWFGDDERWNVYARAGANRWSASAKATNGVQSALAEDSGTDFGYGAGLGVMADRALWRLEYERSQMDDADVDLITLSITWLF